MVKKSEHRRGEHKQCVVLCERHPEDRDKLSDGEDRHQSAIAHPIAKRKQKKNTQSKSDLVQCRHHTDHRFADAKVFGDRRDDWMNVVGVGCNDRGCCSNYIEFCVR